MAAQPVNWLQYNQAAGNPSVAQPWMQQLGGQQAGQVLGNTGNQLQPQPFPGIDQGWTPGTGFPGGPPLGEFQPQPVIQQPETFENSFWGREARLGQGNIQPLNQTNYSTPGTRSTGTPNVMDYRN